MKKKLATTAVLTALVLGMTFSGAAQGTDLEDTNTPNENDTSLNEGSNINVNISSTTQIDVKPNSLSFDNLDVGTQTTTENTGDNRFGSFSIENIGSEYIDLIWAQASRPASDPFGTGDPNAYNAGNFLQIRPADTTRGGVSGSSNYHYVNRYEYANSWTSSQGEIPSYIEAVPGETRSGGDPSDTFVGRIQAGDEWYFYTVVPASGESTCDDSGADLRIGNERHSSNLFGTSNFTAANQNDGGATGYTQYDLESTNGEYGLTQSSVSLDFDIDDDGTTDTTRSYDFLTVCDTSGNVDESEPHVIRTRYNPQAGDIPDLTQNATGDAGDNSGTQVQFLLDAGDASENLVPGEHIQVDAAIEVPQGVPEGGVSTGQLTFYVTSDDDAQQ